MRRNQLRSLGLETAFHYAIQLKILIVLLQNFFVFIEQLLFLSVVLVLEILLDHVSLSPSPVHKSAFQPQLPLGLTTDPLTH